jgi:hypothetical protein
MEVGDLEQPLIAARREIELLVPAVVVDDRRRRETHLLEVEQRVRQPQQHDVERIEHHDRLEQTIPTPFSGDDEAHGNR